MKRPSVTAAALASSVCLVAACGSSSGGPKSPSPSESSSSTAKAQQLVVGSVAGPDAPGFGDGIRARIDAFNRAGGASGVTVKYLGNRNNNDDPSTDLTLIKQLVLNDHVDAAFSYPTVTQPAAGQFLKQHNVPLIGLGINPIFCNNDDAFALSGCLVPGVAKQSAITLTEDQGFLPLVPTILPTLKGVRVAVVGLSASNGQIYTNIWANAAKAAGANVVYNAGPIPLSTTVDYQPFVSAVSATHPQVVMLILGVTEGIAFKAKWNQDGYKGSVFDNTYSPSALSDPATAAALDNQYSYVQVPTPLDTSPWATEMKADFAADGIKDSQISLGTLMGYDSADLYVAMLKKAGPNVKQLASVINRGFSYAPDGGNATTWPQDHAGWTKACVAITKAEGTKANLVVPFTCYAAPA
jgi:ABC-type branched-subunit amino acid transport system substrate-binding protein